MPEIRYFEVTETRKVKVAANSPDDAVRIAAAAFEHGQNSDYAVKNGHGPHDVWGNTISKVRVVKMKVDEKR